MITMKILFLALFLIFSSEAKPSSSICNDIAQGIEGDDVDPLAVNECTSCDNIVKLDSKVVSSAPVPPEFSDEDEIELEYETAIELEKPRRIASIKIQGDSSLGVSKLRIFFKVSSGFVPICDGDGNAMIFVVDIDSYTPHEIKLPVFIETSEIQIKLSGNGFEPNIQIELYGCDEEEDLDNLPMSDSGSSGRFDTIISFLKMMFQPKVVNEDDCYPRCRFYIPGTCECDVSRHEKLFEMDILLDGDTDIALDEVLGITDHSVQRAAKKGGNDWQNFRRGKRYRIPYTIENTFTSAGVNLIRESIRELSRVTCIDLEPANSGDGMQRINFVKRGGCYSPVGKSFRGNEVSIGQGCEHKGIILHEIIHSLGFWHEQSRTDRDKHVIIVWENIREGLKYNFRKQSAQTTDEKGSRYDVSSLMHYGGYAFSKNGRPTIIDKSKNRAIVGQRRGMSSEDINQINTMYPCSVAPAPTTTTTSPPKPNCVDKITYCRFLTSYCRRRRFRKAMKHYCPKTCRFC